MTVAVPKNFPEAAENEITNIFNLAHIEVKFNHDPKLANFEVRYETLPDGKPGESKEFNGKPLGPKLVLVDAAQLLKMAIALNTSGVMPNASSVIAMGRIVSHEIGHKFLGWHKFDQEGKPVNFPTGLMRAVVDKEIFTPHRMFDDKFFFTSRQDQQIYEKCCH